MILATAKGAAAVCVLLVVGHACSCSNTMRQQESWSVGVGMLQAEACRTWLAFAVAFSAPVQPKTPKGPLEACFVFGLRLRPDWFAFKSCRAIAPKP